MHDAETLQLLVGRLRRTLAHHVAMGTWAAPGGRRPAAGAMDADASLRDEARPAAGGTPPSARLAAIRDELGACQRCGLCAARQSIVFGVGQATAPLMFIGEGPGADEDATGVPFVGRAGQLLDKMIVAMGWSREAVYIANVVKCRPPQNRTPTPAEIAACSPFLHAQIQAIRPRVIVALGRPAANWLLDNDAPISAIRGSFFDRHGARVLATFHPAFLLRQPERKRDAWQDLQLVMAELARLGITPS